MRTISEMVIPVWNSIVGLGGLRNRWRSMSTKFWPQTRPNYEGSEITYDAARSLYRNDGEMTLGAGFCKPIIDLQVGFIGIPLAQLDDEGLSDYLNECLSNYWVDEIQQMLRDTIRDSKCVVRMHRPDIFDPLMTMEEREHGYLEIIPPELVTIEYNERNKRIMDRAVISRRMRFVVDDGNVSQGVDPTVEEHDVLEIITRDRVSFFDKQTNEYIDSLGYDNRFNFVPLLEVFNEWDASLQGGQSDLESVLPLVRALNDVVAQGLQAHGYHSVPKVKFKIGDIATFVTNNFPEALDENGRIKPQSTISWRGREVIFLDRDDDAGFIEAKSVLGDTKTLAEFLIDCICIASQTPEWAFMRVDSGSANSDRNAQTVPFVKKIGRKRNNFSKAIQELCKMALVMRDGIPYRPKLRWEMTRADDQLVTTQALQQLIMGLEVAKQSQIISDETYRQMLRMFIPTMKPSDQEEKDALENTQPALPAPSGSQNGQGDSEAVPVPVRGGPQGRNE